MMEIRICQVDYRHPAHARAVVELLDHYARDPMGGGRSLTASVRDNLVAELHRRPWALSLLAFSDDRAVGLLNAFEGFSTFACKPLINIHDLVIHRDYRGRGLGRRLLTAIEDIARTRGCCKLTLEVLGGNTVAKAAYRRFGFDAYRLSEETGPSEFWQKVLDTTGPGTLGPQRGLQNVHNT